MYAINVGMKISLQICHLYNIYRYRICNIFFFQVFVRQQIISKLACKKNAEKRIDES